MTCSVQASQRSESDRERPRRRGARAPPRVASITISVSIYTQHTCHTQPPCLPPHPNICACMCHACPLPVRPGPATRGATVSTVPRCYSLHPTRNPPAPCPQTAYICAVSVRASRSKSALLNRPPLLAPTSPPTPSHGAQATTATTAAAPRARRASLSRRAEAPRVRGLTSACAVSFPASPSFPPSSQR